MQYSIWLVIYVISFSIASSKFIWSIACDNISFSLKAVQHSTTCIQYILSTYYHYTQGLLPFLCIVNKVAMNVGGKISLTQVAFNSFGYLYWKYKNWNVLLCVFPKIVSFHKDFWFSTSSPIFIVFSGICPDRYEMCS